MKFLIFCHIFWGGVHILHIFCHILPYCAYGKGGCSYGKGQVHTAKRVHIFCIFCILFNIFCILYIFCTYIFCIFCIFCIYITEKIILKPGMGTAVIPGLRWHIFEIYEIFDFLSYFLGGCSYSAYFLSYSAILCIRKGGVFIRKGAGSYGEEGTHILHILHII